MPTIRHTAMSARMAGSEVLLARTESRVFILSPTGSIASLPAEIYDQAGFSEVEEYLSEEGFFEQKHDTDTYYVTVMIAMSCNLRCGYCIQNTKYRGKGDVVRARSGVMTPQTALATARFIAEQCRRQGKSKVRVLLFGGEPWLNVTRCVELLRAVANLVELAGARIVTNGTLITPSSLNRLVAAGVDDIQVTFDGVEADHDEHRVYARGAGSYAKIVENLASVEGKRGIKRRLRVNLTGSNIAGIKMLLDDLATRLNPALYKIDFAVIDDNGIGWSDVVQEGTVWGTIDELYWYAFELGFEPGLPESLSPFCNYCSESFGDGGAVVTELGSLVPCWDAATDPSRIVGHVNTGYFRRTSRLEELWQPCGYQSVNRDHAGDTDGRGLRTTLFEIAVARLSGGERRIDESVAPASRS